MKLAFVLGTRPEVIKLAPVIHTARQAGEETTVIATGQHREMLAQMFADFEITPDYSLNVMRDRQQLGQLAAGLLHSLSVTLEELQPDVLLVQGDTLSVFCGALAAFYQQIPVAHVEAGLRTATIDDPFPEEANRRLVAPLARFHFCPTERARANLLREGISDSAVSVVGNTVIDALNWASHRIEPPAAKTENERRLLVTLHRRENQGETMRALAETVRRLATQKQISVLFPVHKNPAVRDAVTPALGGAANVTLCEPLDYLDFVQALAWCDVVLTDSGGIQEEAPSLGKPVLVARETTERQEAIEAGVARLVGTNPVRVYDAVASLFDDPDQYAAMAHPANPFGDGHTAERIVAILSDVLALREAA